VVLLQRSAHFCWPCVQIANSADPPKPLTPLIATKPPGACKAKASRLCRWSYSQPDVGAIKGYPLGPSSDRKSAQIRAIVGPQLAHGVARTARYPDIDTVEGHGLRTSSHCEGTQISHHHWRATL
jgi:hypothetical protein